jgi:hypothetical protein
MAASPRTAGHLLDQHSLATRQVDQQASSFCASIPQNVAATETATIRKKAMNRRPNLPWMLVMFTGLSVPFRASEDPLKIFYTPIERARSKDDPGFLGFNCA